MKKVIIFISWVLVTAISFTLSPWSELGFGSFLASCLLLGFGQWLILLMKTRISGWFIPVTAIAWFITWFVVVMIHSIFNLSSAYFSFVIIADIIAGVIMGLSQWLFLRLKLINAGWWILSNVLGWVVAFSPVFIYINNEPLINSDILPNSGWDDGLLMGTAIGIITGITLVLLPVRQPETEIPSQTPVVPG